MSKIGATEMSVQKQVIKFFSDVLKYKFLGNFKDKNNTNIIEKELLLYLKSSSKHYSDALIKRAINLFRKESKDLSCGLYDANKRVYNLLKYGAKVRDNIFNKDKNVYLIDFEHSDENIYSFAEEVTVEQDNVKKRLDLVFYINGIAIAVLELKRSSVSVSEGIRQNLTNQSANYIMNFFTTIQFCLAGNESEGLRTGTVGTPERFYSEWHEDAYCDYPDERDDIDVYIEDKCNEIEEKLYKQLYSLFYSKRLLNLINNYVVYDNGNKKICRYPQYYAIERAKNRIKKKKGGIIWHVQGSGKSLLMVWLSRWILENQPNSRVLIVTDREELDSRIETLYKDVNESIIRTKSGNDLIQKLELSENRLMCSLIHKFGRRLGEITDLDYEKYIEELEKSLPKNFSAKGDIVVFVDECHRTQTGKLHKAMKAILPKAVFIGFTGTPLLKKDKKTSLEVFGGYIHTYKFYEGVKDGIILDLRYEARDIPQDIISQEKIDTWFNVKTNGLNETAKHALKQKWATMQTLYSSKSRLDKIAVEIITDFGTKLRLKDGNGNALLVASSIYEACKFYEIFVNNHFKECAIISSYTPTPGDLRTDTVSRDEDTETFEKNEIYTKMLDGKSVSEFEEEAIRKFVFEPANMKLLIVVAKLIIGFDAPPCTYLYIDKSMCDHELFQAVCRVNRIAADKDFGYIVDFRQLFGNLADSLYKYASESNAFKNFDAEDIKGLLKNNSDESKKYFEKALDDLESLCEGVKAPKNQIDYQHYFCGESDGNNENDDVFIGRREKLYKFVNLLIKSYAEFKPYWDNFKYTFDEKNKINQKVKFYTELKPTIGRASGDLIDLKMYEPGMRFLIDNYIIADGGEIISGFDDFTLLDFINENINVEEPKKQVVISETIENNIRKKIVEKININPVYYEKMSEILKQLIANRKKDVIIFKNLLEEYKKLCENVNNPENNDIYPESIKQSEALRSFYDNFNNDEALALQLNECIKSTKQDEFRTNPVKVKKIKRALAMLLKKDSFVERAYKIAYYSPEY